MSKSQKIEELKRCLQPEPSPVVACSVKHYGKREEVQPGDLFRIEGKQLSLQEIEALPGRNVVVTIVKDNSHE